MAWEGSFYLFGGGGGGSGSHFKVTACAKKKKTTPTHRVTVPCQCLLMCSGFLYLKTPRKFNRFFCEIKVKTLFCNSMFGSDVVGKCLLQNS